MTEKEAREKWCPMVRRIECIELDDETEQHIGPFNRVSTITLDGADHNWTLCRCLASDCACWVVISKWEDGRNLPQDQWQGRCGLVRG